MRRQAVDLTTSRRSIVVSTLPGRSQFPTSSPAKRQRPNPSDRPLSQHLQSQLSPAPSSGPAPSPSPSPAASASLSSASPAFQSQSSVFSPAPLPLPSGPTAGQAPPSPSPSLSSTTPLDRLAPLQRAPARLATQPKPFTPDNNLIQTLQRRGCRVASRGVPHSKLPTFLRPRLMSDFHIVATADLFDEKSVSDTQTVSLQQRVRVAEIIVAEDIVVGLSHYGKACAFDAVSMRLLCCLNFPKEQVRTVYFESSSRSLIIVSWLDNSQFDQPLTFRSLSLDAVRRGALNEAQVAFDPEAMGHPCMADLDYHNNTCTVSCPRDRRYKVFCTESRRLLYEVDYPNIDDIRACPGILMIIFQRQKTHIPLKLLNIRTGEELLSLNPIIHMNRKVEYVDLCETTIFLKQHDECLNFIDIHTGEQKALQNDWRRDAAAFTALCATRRLLVYRKDGYIDVWQHDRDVIQTLEDHLLYTGNSHITTSVNVSQTAIVSFCRDPASPFEGCICASDLETGRLLSRIAVDDTKTKGLDGSNPLAKSAKADAEHAARSALIRRGLSNVTSLFYHEPSNTIFTGDRNGCIYRWSSRA